MLRMSIFLTLTLICFAGCSQDVATDQSIDLSGTWEFQLGLSATENTMAPPIQPLELPADFNDTVQLPGTTDTNQKGVKTVGSSHGTYTRRYHHIGRAWYNRTISIPTDWQGKNVELFIERALWKTTVYLDGKLHGDYDSLTTPHTYNLGPIEPGDHTLTVCVDNSMIYNIGDKGHGYSENMQTIWNGMIGKLELRALNTVQIQAIRTQFNTDKSQPPQALLTVRNAGAEKQECSLSLELTTATGIKTVTNSVAVLQPGQQTVTCPLPKQLSLWDEFNPHLYEALVTVQTKSETTRWQGKLGFCEPGTNGTHITINGRPTFLRGNLDNCHFPLTGHPPMDKAGWLHVWNTYKQFGYNHVRFHTWCPPEAAFAAADEAGIYIQAECGVWIDGWMKERVASSPDGISDENPAVRDHVAREMKRIVDAYGHHPSFIMHCIGNEFGSSDFETLAQIVTETRTHDGTSRLYSCSTARTLQPEIDDYFVSHQNPAGSMRGLRGPRTNWTYDNVKRGAPETPLILHELGQWPVWPTWNEIDKYTGVLEARNLQEFKELARKNNILSQDAEFQSATGKFSVLLYKAEMEGAYRSKTYAGFHSLGLQDYIGQGEALIGILDMFYDLKPGTITPKEYRQFCSPVVPLAQFSKYVWTSGETFIALMQVSNFSADPINKSITWKLESKDGKTLKQGVFEYALPQGAVTDLGKISVKLNTNTPLACTLELAIEGTSYKNTWPIWVYPAAQKIDESRVVVSDSFDDKLIESLHAGETVVLMAANCTGAKSTHRNMFWPVYWSTRWFPGQGRTLGLLSNPDHPLFNLFPSDGYCNWQWFEIINSSTAMIFDGAPADYRPIVQPVDDFHIGRKLGTIFETKVGKGKLLVCVYPLRKRLDNVSCRQLYAALLDYAASSDFQPKTELPIDWLKTNLTPLSPVTVAGKNPIGSTPAALWVRVAKKAEPQPNKIPYAADLDLVEVQNDGYDYGLSGWAVRLHKDGRSCIYGKRMSLKITLPKGVEGTLYVKFSDWDNNGKTGKIIFEHRSFVLGKHAEKEGRWLEFNVMREDALDNTLEMSATAITGGNLQIDEFVFIPKNHTALE